MRNEVTGRDLTDRELAALLGAPHRVRFENVGRGKKTWEAEVKNLCFDTIVRAVRKGGALISSSIDVDRSDDWPCQGAIYVRMSRKVGHWRVVVPLFVCSKCSANLYDQADVADVLDPGQLIICLRCASVRAC